MIPGRPDPRFVLFCFFLLTHTRTGEGSSESVRATSASMDSCPVCYATFSSDDADTVPRKLPCDHVACTQCLRDCFEEASERRDPSEPVRSLPPLSVCVPRATAFPSGRLLPSIARAHCCCVLCNDGCTPTDDCCAHKHANQLRDGFLGSVNVQCSCLVRPDLKKKCNSNSVFFLFSFSPQITYLSVFVVTF